MSLEEAINNHAAAIRELAQAMLGSAISAVITTQKTTKAKAEKPTDHQVGPDHLNAAAAIAEHKASITDADKAETTLTYADLKGPFLDLVKAKGRDAAIVAITPVGYATLKDAEGKDADYAALLAAIQKASA